MSRAMSSGIVESAGAGDEQNEQRQQAQRSRLVARLLSASPDLPAFLNDLITTQAVVVAGTEAAAFVIRKGQQSGYILEAAAHVRPDGAPDDVRQQALEAFKQLVMPLVQQDQDGTIELVKASGNDEGQYCLVTILRGENDLVAVSAVITRCLDLERAQQRMVSMQLVAGYFDLFTLRRKSEQALALATNHQDVLQYATAVGTADDFTNSAANLCNALANRTGAVRVSLGWVKRNNVKIKALSHTELFDKRQELIISLERVMEESADQDEPVYYNPTPEIGEPSTPNVNREAAAFSRQQAGNSVLSVPLRNRGEIVGVLTLEWAAKVALPSGAVHGMTVAADVLAPQLEDRFQNDRYLFTKAGRSAAWLSKKTFGPEHWVAKLVTIGIVLVVISLFAYRPMYTVSAPFQFATVEKRVVSVPFDGYLGALAKNADGEELRAGMHVHAGDLLVSMDTADQEVRKAQAISEANAAVIAGRNYQAQGKTAESLEQFQRAEAKRHEADSYQYQIDKGRIVAPIDGEILKCDAEDRHGSQVKGGDNLFEIAPIDKLRIEVSVDERDIQLIKSGQTAHLATTSLPTDKHGFIIERVVPQGIPKDGQNVFTVYGKLTGPVDPSWRPGLAGEAAIDIDHRSLFYKWTHRALEWVQLKSWTWL